MSPKSPALTFLIGFVLCHPAWCGDAPPASAAPSDTASKPAGQELHQQPYKPSHEGQRTRSITDMLPKQRAPSPTPPPSTTPQLGSKPAVTPKPAITESTQTPKQ